MKTLLCAVMALILLIAVVPTGLVEDAQALSIANVDGEAAIGDTVYSTFADAMAEATSGDIVKLQKNVTTTLVNVLSGVTLDLNGYTMETTYLFAVKSANVIDSTYTGLLKVDPDNIVLSETNSQIPVWNAEDGFVFVRAAIIDDNGSTMGIVINDETGDLEFSFMPVFGGAGAIEQNTIKEFLGDGASDNKMSVVVRLEWETDNGIAYQDFVYNNALVANVANNRLKGYCTLTLHNYAKLKNLGIKAMILSETGAKLDGGYVDIPVSYTVTFKDWDGTVLKTESVVSGNAATAPSNPNRDGYTFTGWDKEFGNITSDLIVNAQYQLKTDDMPETIVDPTIMVSNVTAAAGESVAVPIIVYNNPGVAGAKITIAYDSSLVLSAAESGTAFSALDYTKPGVYTSPCNFTWDSLSGMVTDNGTILTLTFEIPDDAVSGETYIITCTSKAGYIYDENLDNVSFEIISGMITVS